MIAQMNGIDGFVNGRNESVHSVNPCYKPDIIYPPAPLPPPSLNPSQWWGEEGRGNSERDSEGAQ